MSEINLYELGFYNGYSSCMLQELAMKLERIRDRKEPFIFEDILSEIRDISNCLEMQIEE